MAKKASKKAAHLVAQPATNLVVLPHSYKHPLRHGKIVDDAPGNDQVEVTVRVRRRSPLAETAMTGTMSRDKYEREHGADPADVEVVEDYARSFGIQVVGHSLERRSVFLSGTVTQFNEALNVALKTVERDGMHYRSRSGGIHVPEHLAEMVEGIFGLDNRPFARPHFRRHKQAEAPARSPRATAHAGTLGISPVEVAHRYNFPTGVTGKGEVIGILELGGGFQPAELLQYWQEIGVSPAPSVVVGTNPIGGMNNPTGDPEGPDGEVLLDIEVVGAVAPGAQIVVYFGKDASDRGFLDCLTAAIHDPAHNISILSISWGGAEVDMTDQFQISFNQTLETAKALGITVCVAAGDDGSADFPPNDPRRPWDGHAHVDFPASSPHVLACGGTRMDLLPNGGISESVWHTGQNQGTGGGVSRVYPLPSYQTTSRVPKRANPIGPVKRGVPDVAGNADPNTGYRVRCDGVTFPIGGTSAVAPLWAGLVALMNQALKRRLGFINPALYALPASSGAFNDITLGNNGDYAARKGWDACTGLGTPNGQKLLAALQTLPANAPPAQHELERELPPPTPSGSDISEADRHALLGQLLRVAEAILGGMNAPASATLTPGTGGRVFGKRDVTGGEDVFTVVCQELEVFYTFPQPLTGDTPLEGVFSGMAAAHQPPGGEPLLDGFIRRVIKRTGRGYGLEPSWLMTDPYEFLKDFVQAVIAHNTP
jgi:kumamolisin